MLCQHGALDSIIFPHKKKTERDWDYLGRENISWIKTHNTTAIHHPWVRLAIEVVVAWIHFCCDVCVFAVSTIYHDNTWKGKAFHQCMCILSPLLPTVFVLHANYYRLTVNGCSDVSNTRETSSKSFLFAFHASLFYTAVLPINKLVELCYSKASIFWWVWTGESFAPFVWECGMMFVCKILLLT